MQFKKYAKALEKQFNKMTEGQLYVMNIAKDDVWDMYLQSFPPGMNPIYKERTEHDCNCCKNFIRHIGNLVAIIDGKLVSIWDVEVNSFYNEIGKELSKFVKQQEIKDVFFHFESKAGAESTTQQLEDKKIKTWHHFHCTIPNHFVSSEAAARKGAVNQVHAVLSRGLKELSVDSLEIVLDLISQDSIYRGAEHKDTVIAFTSMKNMYDKLETDIERDIFCWQHVKDRSAKFRNTVIGTLIQDLSEGVELDKAVKSFEDKVAPANYKRTSALVTPGMKANALKDIQALDLEDSLTRRPAVIEDISINNVLFANREASKVMKGSVTDLLTSKPKASSKVYKNVDEIKIDDFIKNILPNIETMEVLVDNQHTANFMTLIAPQHLEAKNLLQWDNPFSWSYNGNVTDSMKARVKTAGGKVDGVLRFSMQWNEDGNDGGNDLDAHCIDANGIHIYYSNRRNRDTGGNLDVDITNPASQTPDGTAVENITWPDLNKMKDGTYKFHVNNFSGRNAGGFRAEIEFNGEVHSFDYDRSVTSDVQVAEVTLKNGVFTLKPILPANSAAKTEWGITTKEFQPVNTLMLSPNYWDEQTNGNKHYFFMLKDCINPLKMRGIYSEFLRGDLVKHRKVFEMLGDKMQCEVTDTQLSGIGFSSTKRDEIICKVTGNFTRTLKIKF